VRKSIHRYDLATGADQALPLAGLREAVAMDFDYDRNCLYWADISLDTIQVTGAFIVKGNSRSESYRCDRSFYCFTYTYTPPSACV